MEDKGYPKYQYSVFPKNGVDSQFVVRSDNYDEFLKLVGEIQILIAKNKKEYEAIVPAQMVAPTSPIQEDTTAEPVTKTCPIHAPALLYRKDGKFGPFFSHKIGDLNGKPIYCNGLK